MDSDTTFTTTTSDANATSRLGWRVAKLCHGGEVIELVSDLGGGKTVFVKGLAKGLGYEGDVTSPTFSLSRDYELPNGAMLHHLDLYRIATGDIVAQELAEFLEDPKSIVAVEWAGNVENALPDARIKIVLQPVSEDERRVTIMATDPKFAYIIEGLRNGESV